MAKYALYSTTKNAIRGLTMGMAVELGKHNIRVNAVGPGYVHAEQNFDLIRTWTDDPEGWVDQYRKYQQAIERFIDPVDVGNVVAFLLSDLARAITGQVIYVDNGATSLLFNRDFSE
jgi:NAD(P)-dependent dehydrogenase (short-subunit alcohol dehydrogenase family)